MVSNRWSIGFFFLWSLSSSFFLGFFKLMIQSGYALDVRRHSGLPQVLGNFLRSLFLIYTSQLVSLYCILKEESSCIFTFSRVVLWFPQSVGGLQTRAEKDIKLSHSSPFQECLFAHTYVVSFHLPSTSQFKFGQTCFCPILTQLIKVQSSVLQRRYLKIRNWAQNTLWEQRPPKD